MNSTCAWGCDRGKILDSVCQNCRGLCFSTIYTGEIVCPYCGAEHDHVDMEIYGEEKATLGCSDCEKEFDVFGHIIQSFSTTKRG